MSNYIKNLGLASILTMGLVRASEITLGFESLADLADMNTDEIKSLDSRLFPEGIFAVRGTEALLSKSEKEGIDPETNEPFLPLFALNHKFEILEAKPLDKGIDPESMVGRVLTQRRTFWPKSFLEEIALVKGDYEKIGLETAGRMGGAEGSEPGWIEGIVDHTFALKVTHSKPNKDGTQFVRINFLKIKKQETDEAA